MDKVAVIFTGGTISMKVDERLKAAIPALSDEEILSTVTGVERIAKVESVHFGSYPGPHMNVERMVELAEVIRGLMDREDIKGIVVTHGTDVLEETAYFLDLVLPRTKAVAVTGAMRSSSELGYDGPANLSAAICTVLAKESVGQGVLVVMNNQVYSADEVTKIHTLALDTFQSPDFGPLGIIDQDQVIYYRYRKVSAKPMMASSQKKVGLIKTVAGDTGDLVRAYLNLSYDGLIVEAMGRGNVPPEMVAPIGQALDRNIPVVIVSRCLRGRVLDSYGYDGGGKQLRDMGAILGDNLSGQKARLKLMLILSESTDMADIRQRFEEDLYGTL